MAKAEEKLADRLAKIAELQKARDEITRELEVLLGLRQPELALAKPDGFVQGDAVVEAVQEAGKPLSAAEIAVSIERKWKYKIDPAQARNSGKYIAQHDPQRLGYDEKTKRFFIPSQT